MALLPIRKYGDPVLRTPAKPVTDIDEKLKKLIRDMFETMYAEPGVGLAAPQVGVSLRLMVIDVSPEGQSQPLVLINPKIESVSEQKVKAEEGCLSFPKIFLEISRGAQVTVSAINEQGLPVTVEAGGLLGRCILHEYDHLEGKLFIDQLSFWNRWKVEQEIRQRKKEGTW